MEKFEIDIQGLILKINAKMDPKGRKRNNIGRDPEEKFRDRP